MVLDVFISADTKIRCRGSEYKMIWRTADLTFDSGALMLDIKLLSGVLLKVILLLVFHIL